MRRLFAVLCALAATAAGADVRLRSAMEVQLGSTIGQMRAVPVQTGCDAAPAFLLVYGPDVVVDPYHEMFFYPAGTLNLALVSDGRIIWKRDLGRSVVPGMWFCPVFPFDLDGDGADEIWFVDNVDSDHPLSLRGPAPGAAECAGRQPRGPVRIQPVLDWVRNRWSFFTCRESDPARSPRVALFNGMGARVWGDIEKGHMDVGWVAHLDARGPTSMALRIGSKTLGPKGLVRSGVEEFVWDTFTGKRRQLPFSVAGTLPVDIDGDGFMNSCGAEALLKESSSMDAGRFWPRFPEPSPALPSCFTGPANSS